MSKKKVKVVDREGVKNGFLRGGISVCSTSSPTKARPLLFNVGWNAPPYKDEVFVSLLERIGESITLCVGSDICRCDRCQIFRKVKFVVLLCLKELEKKKKVLQGKDKWKYEVVLWSDVLKIIGEVKRNG